MMVAVGLLLADRCTQYVADKLRLVSSSWAGDAAGVAPVTDLDAAVTNAGAWQGPKEVDQGALAGKAESGAAVAAAASGAPDFGAALRESACHRARLLHYFPPEAAGGEEEGDWCGWHFDHGSLTGGLLVMLHACSSMCACFTHACNAGCFMCMHTCGARFDRLSVIPIKHKSSPSSSNSCLTPTSTSPLSPKTPTPSCPPPPPSPQP